LIQSKDKQYLTKTYAYVTTSYFLRRYKQSAVGAE